MPCEWYKTADGQLMHIHRGHSTGPKRRCRFCQLPYREGRLCDFPIGKGKTCDAEMCSSCARTLGAQNTPVGAGMQRLGDTIDVCPAHRSKVFVSGGKIHFEPDQPSLFPETF
jgi:hypothetical protein